MPKKISSAGILPFSIAPNSANDIYVLLGKEDNIPGWKYGSNKWCDFAGSSENSDIDVEMTAAREFIEESLAIVSLTEKPRHSNDDRFEEIPDISKLLRNKKFAHKVTLLRKSQGDICKHVLYLKQVPWMPHLPNNFQNVRNRLGQLRNHLRKYDESVLKLPIDFPFPGRSVHIKGQRGPVVNIQNFGHDSVNISIWCTVAKSVRSVVLKITEICDDIPAVKNVIENWQKLRQTFYRLPYSLRNHPAIDVKMVYKTALILKIKINDIYLEKQSINWWSLPRLLEVIRQGGIYHNEFFRPSFLPYLSVIVDVLSEIHSDMLPDKYKVTVNPWNNSSKLKNEFPNHSNNVDEGDKECQKLKTD